MSYDDIAKELKKNIQIMDNSFESNNLQILDIACSLGRGTFDYLKFLIELSTITGSRINNDCYIKINLYNDEGELYKSNWVDIEKRNFTGYDTIQISFSEEIGSFDNIVKARLYLTIY